jgi:hypothetical protein
MHVVGVQTVHLPPLHCWPLPHVPHCSAPPQPSGITPQVTPCAAHVVGVQHFPVPRQTWPLGQSPQSILPPQASFARPHWMPCAAHVVGVQQCPAAQTSAPGHVPHCSVVPHPSASCPQLRPFAAHVVGAQATHFPPPQTWLLGHVPHCSAPPHPSSMIPHETPREEQVAVGVQPPDLPKHSQPNEASHCTIELAMPAPNDCTMKSWLMTAPLFESKSHAYSSYKGPLGVAVPAVQPLTSVVPQRHGISICVAAHIDE